MLYFGRAKWNKAVAEEFSSDDAGCVLDLSARREIEANESDVPRRTVSLDSQREKKGRKKERMKERISVAISGRTEPKRGRERTTA